MLKPKNKLDYLTLLVSGFESPTKDKSVKEIKSEAWKRESLSFVINVLNFEIWYSGICLWVVKLSRPNFWHPKSNFIWLMEATKKKKKKNQFAYNHSAFQLHNYHERWFRKWGIKLEKLWGFYTNRVV